MRGVCVQIDSCHSTCLTSLQRCTSFCSQEAMAHSQQTYVDPVLVKNDKALQHLLQREDCYIPECDYFVRVQEEIKPHMRKTLVTWMFEVCEEEQCQQEVFTMATNYVDRILALMPIEKSQFQLLGTVCLLIASKLEEVNHLPMGKLIHYTDYSITKEDLLKWECLVVDKLKWDIWSVTPLCFVEHLLARLKMPEGLDLSMVNRHARTLIGLCCLDYKFTLKAPSMISASAICAAFEGLRSVLKTKSPTEMEMLQMMHELINVEKDCIARCQAQIEDILCVKEESEPDVGKVAKLEDSDDALSDLDQPPTPTDIQEVTEL